MFPTFFFDVCVSVTRSISRALGQVNLTPRAINCYVRIARQLDLEVLAPLQLPARRIQRRESVPDAVADRKRIQAEQLVIQNEQAGIQNEEAIAQPRMIQNRRNSMPEFQNIVYPIQDEIVMVERRFNEVLGQPAEDVVELPMNNLDQSEVKLNHFEKFRKLAPIGTI